MACWQFCCLACYQPRLRILSGIDFILFKFFSFNPEWSRFRNDPLNLVKEGSNINLRNNFSIVRVIGTLYKLPSDLNRIIAEHKFKKALMGYWDFVQRVPFIMTKIISMKSLCYYHWHSTGIFYKNFYSLLIF